jgi:release factor glutamine methyltransferase
LFFRDAIKQLQNGIPFQYVLGKVFFHSLELQIAPGALIPRPETEELVEWVIQENNEPDISILDIGTGSGCIALALKHVLSSAYVKGIDVSPKAIEIALKNASIHELDVDFSIIDILDERAISSAHQVNIIVSNPPYICEKEKKDMAAHVIEHEPSLALFVPDHDPLLFYRKITFFAKNQLSPFPTGSGGKLYFEVHENYAKEVAELLESNGFNSIEIKKDLQGKQRMVRGILK